MKANLLPGRRRRADQLLYCLEDDSEPLIVFLFQCIDFASKIAIRIQ
jgi:hypothetical protein